MSIQKGVYLGFINFPILLSFILPTFLTVITIYMLGCQLASGYWSICILFGLLISGIILTKLKLMYLGNMVISANIVLGLVVIICVSFLIEKLLLIQLLY